MLEGFKFYDEARVRDYQSTESLNHSFMSSEDDLKYTELSLLKSNRIDRKTILINHC